MRILSLSLFALALVCLARGRENRGRPEEKSKKLVNILYALIDVNDDGLISNDELASTFSKYDTSGNLEIDRKEFTWQWQVVTRTTKEESEAAFALLDFDKSGLIDSKDIKALYVKLDEDGSGTITDREFIRQFSELISDVPYVIMFNRGDTNRDGVLKDDEFDQIFKLFDANGDGTVDAGEFIDLWVAREYNDVRTSKRLYGKLDVNGDDKLDQKNDLAALFIQLDIDKNNSVNQDEFVEGWSKIVASISKRP